MGKCFPIIGFQALLIGLWLLAKYSLDVFEGAQELTEVYLKFCAEEKSGLLFALLTSFYFYLRSLCKMIIVGNSMYELREKKRTATSD